MASLVVNAHRRSQIKRCGFCLTRIDDYAHCGCATGWVEYGTEVWMETRLYAIDQSMWPDAVEAWVQQRWEGIRKVDRFRRPSGFDPVLAGVVAGPEVA